MNRSAAADIDGDRDPVRSVGGDQVASERRVPKGRRAHDRPRRTQVQGGREPLRVFTTDLMTEVQARIEAERTPSAPAPAPAPGNAATEELY